MKENIGVWVDAQPGPGILHKLTGVIAQHDANITSVDIIEEHLAYFEIDVIDGPPVIDDLSKLPSVRRVTLVKTFQAVFGKRIIVMGRGVGRWVVLNGHRLFEVCYQGTWKQTSERIVFQGRHE